MAVVLVMVMFVAGLRFDRPESQRSDDPENEEQFVHRLILVEVDGAANGGFASTGKREASGKSGCASHRCGCNGERFTWPPPP